MTNFVFPQIFRGRTLLLVGLGILLPLHTAIAKPDKPSKPKPSQPPAELITPVETTPSTAVEAISLWSTLIDDLASQYSDLPATLLEKLKTDTNFRTVLFQFFGTEAIGRDAIQEILLEILQSQDTMEGGDGVNLGVVELFDYTYVVDRACLPPGQQQRLDSGKPVPPGILKKCGHIETVELGDRPTTDDDDN